MTRIIGIQHRVKRTAEGESHPTRVAILVGDECVTHELESEIQELEFVKNELRSGDTVSMVLGGSGDYFAYALARRGEEVGASVLRVPAYLLKQWRDGSDKSGDHILLAQMVHEKRSAFYPLAETDAALIRVRELWRATWEAMQARMAAQTRLRQYFIGRVFTDPNGYFPEGGIEKAFDEAKASDAIIAALEKEEAKRLRELTSALEDLDVYTQIFKPLTGAGPKIAARIISAVVDIRRFAPLVDETLIAESYARSDESSRLGRLEEDWNTVDREYNTKYARIEAIIARKRQLGKDEEAKHCLNVLNELRLRKKLRKTGNQAGSGANKLAAYMGVHVLPDGTFPRRRVGQICNWHGDARQALYLLGDQFNRRPDSKWGIRLRENKAKLRLRHPEPVLVDGKNGKVKRYTDGHIHKMALWRTLNEFVKELYEDWNELERSRTPLPLAA